MLRKGRWGTRGCFPTTKVAKQKTTLLAPCYFFTGSLHVGLSKHLLEMGYVSSILSAPAQGLLLGDAPFLCTMKTRSRVLSATDELERGLREGSGRDPAAGASPTLDPAVAPRPQPSLCQDSRPGPPLRPGLRHLSPAASPPPESAPAEAPPAQPRAAGHPTASAAGCRGCLPAPTGRPHLSRTLPRLPALSARSRQPLPGAARSSSSLSLRSNGSARRLRGRDPGVLRTGSDIVPLLPPQRLRATARPGRCSRPEGRAERSRTVRHGTAQLVASRAAWLPASALPLRGPSPCLCLGGLWPFGKRRSSLGPAVRALALLTAWGNRSGICFTHFEMGELSVWLWGRDVSPAWAAGAEKVRYGLRARSSSPVRGRGVGCGDKPGKNHTTVRAGVWLWGETALSNRSQHNHGLFFVTHKVSGALCVF